MPNATHEPGEKTPATLLFPPAPATTMTHQSGEKTHAQKVAELPPPPPDMDPPATGCYVVLSHGLGNAWGQGDVIKAEQFAGVDIHRLKMCKALRNAEAFEAAQQKVTVEYAPANVSLEANIERQRTQIELLTEQNVMFREQLRQAKGGPVHPSVVGAPAPVDHDILRQKDVLIEDLKRQLEFRQAAAQTQPVPHPAPAPAHSEQPHQHAEPGQTLQPQPPPPGNRPRGK